MASFLNMMEPLRVVWFGPPDGQPRRHSPRASFQTTYSDSDPDTPPAQVPAKVPPTVCIVICQHLRGRRSGHRDLWVLITRVRSGGRCVTISSSGRWSCRCWESIMEFGVLGTLVVSRNGAPVDLGGPKQRALLALLLIDANRVVSTDTIIEALWGDDGKDHQNSLWVVVSRLRALLEPDRPKRSDGEILRTQPPGYVLTIDPDDLDAVRFETLAAEGRALLDVDPAGSAVLLGEALSLWRGDPLADFAYEPFAQSEINRLAELRLAALEDRIEADLRLGRSHDLVAELDDVVTRHPFRQRAVGQLMIAQHRSGRQSDALRTYRALRTRLGEELGLDPSSELVELERLIVCDDPSLRSTDVSAGVRDATSVAHEHRTITAERSVRRRSRQLVAVVCVTALFGLAAVLGIARWRDVDGARAVAEQSAGGLDRMNRANGWVSASEQARSLGDAELALLYATAGVRETADLGFAVPDAVDAIHWALQDLGVQYDVGPGEPVAVRAGPTVRPVCM